MSPPADQCRPAGVRRGVLAFLRDEWSDARAGWRGLAATLRGDRQLHLALWLCVPALVAGLALRVVLCRQMPYAFFISDTRNFAEAALELARHGNADLGSRTFLAPCLYALPVLLGVPLLQGAAFLQHLMGWGGILLVGLLCYAWLGRWRLWIVPITTIYALHPTLLWYEHLAVPDTLFMDCALLTAAAGTLFFRRPNALTFGGLLGAIFLTAGARQEGFLFVAYALGLTALVFWKCWARMVVYGLVALAAAAVITGANKTGQGGQMLLTGLFHLCPETLRTDPGYTAVLHPLREKWGPRWHTYPGDHDTARKELMAATMRYLETDKGLSRRAAEEIRDGYCKKVAIEIATANLARMPGIAFNKFIANHRDPYAPDFGPDWLHDRQWRYIFGRADSKNARLLGAYYGRDYAAPELFRRDLETVYYPVFKPDWLSAYQRAYMFATIQERPGSPCRLVGPPGLEQRFPPLPPFYVLGFSGLLGAALTRRPALNATLLWLGMMLLLGAVVALVGGLEPRYRLPLEPFWFIGLGGVGDLAALAWRRLAGGVRRGPPGSHLS